MPFQVDPLSAIIDIMKIYGMSRGIQAQKMAPQMEAYQTGGEQGVAQSFGPDALKKVLQFYGQKPLPDQTQQKFQGQELGGEGYSVPSTPQAQYQPTQTPQYRPGTPTQQFNLAEQRILSEPGQADIAAKRKLGLLPPAGTEATIELREKIMEANMKRFEDINMLRREQFDKNLELRQQIADAKSESDRTKAQAALDKFNSDWQNRYALQDLKHQQAMETLLTKQEVDKAKKGPLPESHVNKVEDLAIQQHIPELIDELYNSQKPITTKPKVSDPNALMLYEQGTQQGKPTGNWFKSKKLIEQELSAELGDKKPNIFWLRKKLSKEKGGKMSEIIKRSNQIMKDEGSDPYTAYDKAMKEQESTKSFRIIGVTQ